MQHNTSPITHVILVTNPEKFVGISCKKLFSESHKFGEWQTDGADVTNISTKYTNQGGEKNVSSLIQTNKIFTRSHQDRISDKRYPN